MNNKIAISILAAIVVVGAGIYYSLPPASPATTSVVPTSTVATTAPQTSLPKQPAQQPAKSQSQPTFTIGTTTVVKSFARFDTDSLTSTSAYPVITGTANVPKIGLTIYTSNGIGIVRPGEVIVTNGRWSYSTSVALAPGTYILILVVGNDNVTAKLIVKNP